jgi:hypothetical protein
MAISKEDILEAVGGMTVMELNDLVKAFEEKFGVSAASMAVAAPGAGGAAAGGGEDRVRRHPDGRWRQQGQRHQDRARHHRPGPEGSQGSGGRRSQARQGRLPQGRGRGHQEAAHRSWRHRRDQVITTWQGVSPTHWLATRVAGLFALLFLHCRNQTSGIAVEGPRPELDS